jgi:hypothetical protein
MDRGSVEHLPNQRVLHREKVGHCFNGFGFVLYVLMSMNFNVHLLMTACG